MADDLIKEVEQEQRRQQLEAFWKKYRGLIIGTVVVVLCTVAGFEGWRYWQTVQKEQAAAAFGQAAKIFARGEGAEKEAAAAFAKVAEAYGGGYGLVARMQEAAARSIAGETDKAVALYDQVAKSAPENSGFADYARLRAGILGVETAPFGKTKERLGPVADGQGPWRFLAQEMLAFAAWRTGDAKTATALLGKIESDAASSEAVRLRAESMKQLIATGVTYADVKAAEAAPAPAAAAPAPTPEAAPAGAPPAPPAPPAQGN